MILDMTWFGSGVGLVFVSWLAGSIIGVVMGIVKRI